jgi:diguanylate cyclase (GGDEF)-like protein
MLCGHPFAAQKASTRGTGCAAHCLQKEEWPAFRGMRERHESRMSVDITKHLERAKKYLEKNKLQDAIAEYQAILATYPNHQESIQALGDIYTRLNDPVRAAQYYGMLFDRYADSGDTTKAAALYSRFLKSVQQSPDRMMRYAMLLQRQNRRDEAIESYGAAGELFAAQGNGADALTCWEKIAQLDPDNPARHVKYAQVAEQLGRPDLASRGYLRAGQLVLAEDADRALDYFARAHELVPDDRSTALLYASALLRKGEAQAAVDLLAPFGLSETDPNFLSVFGTALMESGQRAQARVIFEHLAMERPEEVERLFELAERHLQADEDADAADVLGGLKTRMFAAKRVAEFTAVLDRLLESFPQSTQLAEFAGKTYDELNRESKYFNVLVRLFELYTERGNFTGACGALDRIVDIDPYDPHNHERLERLQGKVEDNYLRGLAARLGKSFTGTGTQPFGREVPEASAEETGPSPEVRERQALEDLIVQAEIFLQYSLQNKAIERLQKIAEMFPGEEENNPRLRNLYDLANWYPPTAKKKEPAMVEARAAALTQTGTFNADTMRDLTKVTEITRGIHRQSTPKSVLALAVNEIGSYLKVSRCIAVIGAPGQPPQMASEFCAAGVGASPPSALMKVLTALGEAPPDSLGAATISVSAVPALAELGLETALGVPLNDRDTQAVAGTLVVGMAGPRKWKQNESYFLQAVGDQVLIGVNHTKLRSLMRNLAVADEKTGLLGRSSYQDCLLSETNRMKTQSTPLSLIILVLDRGPELLRQQGEAQLDRHMEQVAKLLQTGVRQNDLAIKYLSWAVALVLPDTRLADAMNIAEKLRKLAASVRPPWNGAGTTVSAAVVEAVNRPDYESEDIVTDLMNRAEFGLEEARKRGGDAVVSM